jgi:hypothetical protein
MWQMQSVLLLYIIAPPPDFIAYYTVVPKSFETICEEIFLLWNKLRMHRVLKFINTSNFRSRKDFLAVRYKW